MKNKQIYKFMLLFFMCFFVFLNVSYADLVVNQNYTIRSYSPEQDSGYATYYNALLNYKNNPSSSNTTVQTTIIDSQVNQGNDVVFFVDTSGNYNIVYDYDYNSGNGNIVVLDDGINKYIGVLFTPTPSTNQRVGSLFTSRQNSTYVTVNGTSAGQLAFYDDFPLDTLISTTKQLPLMTKNGNSATWNGSYYSSNNTNPIFSFTTSLTDSEIIDVVNNFYASDVFNVPSGYKDFIICYNEYSHDYFILTYKNTENLSKRVIDIPADFFDVNFESLDYETWMLIFSYENANLWQRLFPGVTISDQFYCYSSSDGITFVSEGVRYFADFKEDLRFSVDQPIIYSTQDLNVVIMTETGTSEVAGTYYTDENNPISQTNIDGYENIVTSDGSGNPLKQVLDELKKIPLYMATTFAQVLDGFFNLAENTLDFLGVNIVTLVFAILIKTVTVFVASIALILRFTAFILTLVVIPASSSLLAVDVATNSSGLAFTGLNWGSNLISGLNMIKSFTWNGLSLWTLFEVFVSSLEVIILVKVIRKHYQAL